MAPDSEILKGIATKRTNATEIMKLTTGKHFKLKLSEKLTTPGSFFSLVLDETTDRSTTKQSALRPVSQPRVWSARIYTPRMKIPNY